MARYVRGSAPAEEKDSDSSSDSSSTSSSSSSSSLSDSTSSPSLSGNRPSNEGHVKFLVNTKTAESQQEKVPVSGDAANVAAAVSSGEGPAGSRGLHVAEAAERTTDRPNQENENDDTSRVIQEGVAGEVATLPTDAEVRQIQHGEVLNGVVQLTDFLEHVLNDAVGFGDGDAKRQEVLRKISLEAEHRSWGQVVAHVILRFVTDRVAAERIGDNLRPWQAVWIYLVAQCDMWVDKKKALATWKWMMTGIQLGTWFVFRR